jgi:hypothetical protein
MRLLLGNLNWPPECVVVVIGPTLSFGGRRPYLSNGNAVGLETLTMLR